MDSLPFRRLWNHEYFRTVITLLLIIGLVFGFWYSLTKFLMVEHPLLVVVSGSMCTVGTCDGWSHPFDETLHSGDLIVIKGLTSDEIKAVPSPEGDILVFYRPKPIATSPDELIVHRVINREIRNGLEYFRTKGDGNSVQDHWPADYREEYSWNGMISSELIVGKVIMRIPWIGHIAWFMRSPIGIYLIISLIIILVAIEYVIPRDSKTEKLNTTQERFEST